MKKLSLILAALLLLTLALPTNSLAANDLPLIGIVQYAPHVALDAANQGFVDALRDNGYEDGKTIRIDAQNAQASSDILAAIADSFIAQKADLILAIATPAAQTMAGKTESIPILGTAITDYVVARLAKSNEEPGYNVSGTTDMNPVADQIALLKKLAPDAKTVGLLYTGSEDNSVVQADLAKVAIEGLGMQWIEVKVTNSNDVQQAVQSLVGACDAIYIPTDNVVASSIPIVVEITLAKKIPVICGEEGMVFAGGTATFGVDYYTLGYQTGLMAIKVLDGADISKMPIEAQASFNYAINKESVEALGLEIPEDLLEFVK